MYKNLGIEDDKYIGKKVYVFGHVFLNFSLQSSRPLQMYYVSKYLYAEKGVV